MVGEQIERERVRPGFDVRQPPGPFDDGPHHFLAGGIAEGMDDAIVAMAPFAAEREAAGFEIEIRAPFDQFANSLGCFAHDHIDDLSIAELAAGGKRVGDMILEAVFRIPHAGDTPLGRSAYSIYATDPCSPPRPKAADRWQSRPAGPPTRRR